MGEWTNSDGNPLGEWTACTEAKYLDALNALTNPVVLSGRTEVGESLNDVGYGAPYRDRTIVSEWGERGAAHPTVRCDDRWDYFGERDHSHYRFVPTGASITAPTP